MLERVCAVFKWLVDPVNLTAIATVIIAAFTVVLAAVGYVQARLIRKTIKLARDEFVATHRPKIIVYGMEVQLPGDIGKTRHVNFRYVNAGDTDAVVTSISSRVF